MTTISVMTPHFPPAVHGGGPIRSLEAVVTSAPEHYTTRVISSSRDLNSDEDLVESVDEWTSFGQAQVYYAASHLAGGRVRMWWQLRRSRPDYIYCNSYWSPAFTQAVLMLSRCGFFPGADLMVAPRGEFAEGALTRHALRKKVLMRVNKILGTHRKLVWHAASVHEQRDIRRVIGDDAVIVVQEDATLLPREAAQLPQGSGEDPRLAFLGRVTEHKGLHLAVEALGRSGLAVPLVVYGPEESADYADHCRELARRHSVDLRFHGVLQRGELLTELNRVDLLLLPTRGESFGHVVAETLAAACPVMITPETPWTPRIREHGAGFVVPREADAWTTALTSYRDLTVEQRNDLRRGARAAYQDWTESTAAQPHFFDLMVGSG